jgi:hypothetical protein
MARLVVRADVDMARVASAPFERRLRRRNPVLGEAWEEAVEASP